MKIEKYMEKANKIYTDPLNFEITLNIDFHYIFDLNFLELNIKAFLNFSFEPLSVRYERFRDFKNCLTFLKLKEKETKK